MVKPGGLCEDSFRDKYICGVGGMKDYSYLLIDKDEAGEQIWSLLLFLGADSETEKHSGSRGRA